MYTINVNIIVNDINVHINVKQTAQQQREVLDREEHAEAVVDAVEGQQAGERDGGLLLDYVYIYIYMYTHTKREREIHR